MQIQTINKDEKNWNILFEQIVKGNVIPVIGPELVRVGEKSSQQSLIDAFAGLCSIEEGEMTTFSQLVYDKRFRSRDLGDIHDLLTLNLNSEGNVEYFDKREDNELLYRLLSIPYFPFVITTTFDPIVENMMRRIHGNRLRVLTFRNDAGKNDDIENGEETKLPTLYYMFGKADGKAGSFVVTAEDLLKFSRSWLQPNDSSSNVKPSKLSNELARRYLLVLGCDYQDWLFRFFWYAMKSDSFGKEENGGMLARTRQDSELIAFLTNQAKAFSQVEPNMEHLVNRICEGVAKAEKNTKPATDAISRVPEQGADVFISYSRGDSDLVKELYRILTAHGLNVWYDRQSLHHGLDFMRQIESAIRNSTFFVPVFTDTITKQTVKEHPYRKEWKYAVDHILLIGGISYCFPFMEKGFNMDGLEEKVPKELKSPHAFEFTKEDYQQVAAELAKKLMAEKERRTNNG